ncbi:MAG: FAD-binding oxidoreductase [Deltaproteobacteria bacterium]|nr:FAD-binding oxidoreductase [Deltaproteobacteria bacterium]
MSADVVVVGAGIAGLSAALHIRQHVGARVTLVEQEALPATHSSGRNAGIWLPADGEVTTPPLARRSAVLLDELAPGWLRPQPVVYTATESQRLDPHERTGLAAGCRVSRLDADELRRRVPWMCSARERCGLWVEGAGVIDVHAVTDGLARAARAAGVVFHFGQAAVEVLQRSGEVTGVRLASGDSLTAKHVVIASGAWASRLGRSASTPLPLTALRRHLVQLEGDTLTPGLTLWDLSAPVYFRPESGGLLASPCDESPSEPCLPLADASALDLLAARLEQVAPRLASWGVRRSWACLRTFAPDRELVVGPDPRLPGLHWSVGLGGRGMNVGAAVGELLAAELAGEEHELAGLLSPARLLTDAETGRDRF